MTILCWTLLPYRRMILHIKIDLCVDMERKKNDNKVDRHDRVKHDIHAIKEIDMGVMDKFLNAMKLNPEDEDDYYDDYENDEPIEEKPQRSAYRDRERSYDDDDYEEKVPKKPTKVTPMKQPVRRSSGNGMEVCVIKPTTVEEAREITDTLLSNRTVVLNLEGLDVDIAQRIIDFTSGSTYAIKGNLQKISHYIFIITPASVDISGDFQEILSGSFDVPIRNK